MSASCWCSCTTFEFTGDPGALWLGGALVFASSFLYACYLVGVGPVIARLGSLRFIALAMLTSALFVFAHFLLTRPLTALLVPASHPASCR